MDIFEVLDNLKISYEMIEHKAIYTVEEAKGIDDMLEGDACKNLFLTDHKEHYFLLLVNEDKKVDLKKLSKLLNVGRLSFGSEEKLKELLGLIKGSVTPLGIINDKDNKVILLVDKELVDKKILMHPNINTKTISIEYNDLKKVVEYTEHKMEIINI